MVLKISMQKSGHLSYDYCCWDISLMTNNNIMIKSNFFLTAGDLKRSETISCFNKYILLLWQENLHFHD